MPGQRDLVLGITSVQPDGTLTHSGGRVVKNVSGYDLHRMHTGALGALATSATFVRKLAAPTGAPAWRTAPRPKRLTGRRRAAGRPERDGAAEAFLATRASASGSSGRDGRALPAPFSTRVDEAPRARGHQSGRAVPRADLGCRGQQAPPRRVASGAFAGASWVQRRRRRGLREAARGFPNRVGAPRCVAVDPFDRRAHAGRASSVS
jgi:FAD/FMN-containing dehydrogenase